MRRRQSRPSTVDVISPRVKQAARDMSERLGASGYGHAIIGGLAVYHYGYKRTTADVDFLVSSSAADEINGDSLGGTVRGKSIRRGGIDVDLLFPRAGEEFLEAAIRQADPYIPISALVYLKLSAGRMKDTADLIELLKRGKINPSSTRAYLTKNAPMHVDDFNALVEQAKYEAD